MTLFLLFVWLVTASTRITPGQAIAFVRVCGLRNDDLMKLVYDEASNTYEAIDPDDLSINNKPDESDRLLLRLRGQSQQQSSEDQVRSSSIFGFLDFFSGQETTVVSSSALQASPLTVRHLKNNIADGVPIETDTTTKDPLLSNDNSTTSKQDAVIFARRCRCAISLDTDSFCETSYNICGIEGNGRPHCFVSDPSTILIRNVWPVVLLWYAAMLLFIMCTDHGRNARLFVIHHCCCCLFGRRSLNERIVDRMMMARHLRNNRRRQRHHQQSQRRIQRRRQRASATRTEEGEAAMGDGPTTAGGRGGRFGFRSARSAWIIRRLPFGGNSNGNNHNNGDNNGSVHGDGSSSIMNDDLEDTANRLELKTKLYHRSSDVRNEEEEDEHACTICFLPLTDGERVGKLPCNHNFHVECLKTWLPYRNVCPLCQAPDIAVLRQGGGGVLREQQEVRRTDSRHLGGDSVGNYTTTMSASDRNHPTAAPQLPDAVETSSSEEDEEEEDRRTLS